MTSTIHPEHLFELDRQASLSEAERAARDQHLAACVSCRVEHGLRADFAREPLETEQDDALVQRAMSGALLALSRPPTKPHAPARWRLPASIAAAALAAGVAAAALRSERPPSAPPPPSVRPTTPPETRAVAPAPPGESPSPTPVAVTTASVAHIEPTNAAQLFARANAARRSGDVGRALPLYRRLLTEFGASREARTAEVTMARLLLDTQGNATESLGLFQRYQREQPDGTLAEEAVLGEAEALKLLGRRADEAAAWSRLLERFPTSVHRGRAEARLAEITPPAP